MHTVERSAVMGPINVIQMMINESLLSAQKEIFLRKMEISNGRFSTTSLLRDVVNKWWNTKVDWFLIASV
jgi:hypothetical protein